MSERRVYRRPPNRKRFNSFTLRYRDADIWIAVDRLADRTEVARPACLRHLVQMYTVVENYISQHPGFGSSHQPVTVPQGADPIVRQMARAARGAGVGPMAAVAGAIAGSLGRFVVERLGAGEVVVENGGDIFASLMHPITVAVHAGSSPISGRVGIEIDAADTPLGICTSSATVGHAVSYGAADAFVVISCDAATADAYATAYGNRVRGIDSLPGLVEDAAGQPRIMTALSVMDEQMAVSGLHRLRFISRPERRTNRSDEENYIPTGSDPTW